LKYPLAADRDLFNCFIEHMIATYPMPLTPNSKSDISPEIYKMSTDIHIAKEIINEYTAISKII